MDGTRKPHFVILITCESDRPQLPERGSQCTVESAQRAMEFQILTPYAILPRIGLSERYNCMPCHRLIHTSVD